MLQQPSRREVLEQRQQALAQVWQTFVTGGALPTTGSVLAADIAASWRRCLQHLNPWKTAAPLEVQPVPQKLWEASPLREAILPVQAALEQVVADGSMVAAMADGLGRILWTSANPYMHGRATRVHLVAGSCWDERSAGTNAIALALRHRRTVVVFAAEHYSRYMHDWVCYATPILHPQSGETIGIFSVATLWDNHTPFGELAVTELARTIRRHLPDSQRHAELQIHALGFPRVIFRGQEIHLSLRQTEILCLLILNPQGLPLAGLHSALYGDAPVTLASLKAELSHLRHLLDGQIGSRPYRLLVSTWADFVILWQLLKDQQADQALNLYRGVFMPSSVSPELEEWRNCIEAVMEQVVAACRDPEVLIGSLCNGAQGSERVRERLAELVGESS